MLDLQEKLLGQALNDIKECLVNNPAWAGQITTQLDEARHDFANALGHISVFSPSTGVFTVFLSTTREDGIVYVPTYSIETIKDGFPKRLYVGELAEASDIELSPDTFSKLLRKHYHNDIGALVMLMTSGAYEPRDAEILDDLNLDYTSFRCDINGGGRMFFRSSNNRWRKFDNIEMFGGYMEYLKRNRRVVTIINQKLGPRVGPAICDGSSARRQLEERFDQKLAEKGRYYVNPPEACAICQCPLSLEPFMSDAQMKNPRVWANMCADCTIYHAEGIGWGVGQLYRNEGDDRWLLVAGARLEGE